MIATIIKCTVPQPPENIRIVPVYVNIPSNLSNIGVEWHDKVKHVVFISISFINPQCACARVLVLILSVILSVYLLQQALHVSRT